MTKAVNNSFGDIIRYNRENYKLPLRKVAAELDIDTSTLSKIEKNQRCANKQQVIKLAKLFGISEKDLLINWLSEKIAHDLRYEKNVAEILKKTANKVGHYKKLDKDLK